MGSPIEKVVPWPGVRRTRPALQHLDPASVHTQVFEREQVLVVTRAVPGDSVVSVFGFGSADCELTIELAAGGWEVLLDSHGASPRSSASTCRIARAARHPRELDLGARSGPLK